jgi:hypothetical protein
MKIRNDEKEELDKLINELLANDDSEEDDLDDADDNENQYCSDCFMYPEKVSSIVNEKLQKKRSSDEELKTKALQVFIDELHQLKCNPKECRLGGCCVGKATIEITANLRNDFWGFREARAPRSKERKLKILEILKAAYCKNTKEFRFQIGAAKGGYEVCEAAYAILIGISRSPNKSEISKQWSNQKKYLTNGKEDIYKFKRFKNKFEKVATYIEYMGTIFCETSPLAGLIFLYNNYIIIFINIIIIYIVIIIIKQVEKK